MFSLQMLVPRQVHASPCCNTKAPKIFWLCKTSCQKHESLILQSYHPVTCLQDKKNVLFVAQFCACFKCHETCLFTVQCELSCPKSTRSFRETHAWYMLVRVHHLCFVGKQTRVFFLFVCLTIWKTRKETLNCIPPML